MDHYFTNNENLKSEIKSLSYTYKGVDFTFLSDNGVFSKDHLDYGSRLLLETYLKEHTDSPNDILDVGCGYGFIGIVLAKLFDKKVDMIDINKRAMHLATRNGNENKVLINVFESNKYENVNKKYDLIITNPPVRVGKKDMMDILINAKDYLNEDGALWYVLRKDQGAKSVKKELEKYYNIDVIEKSKGFYIFFCKKH